MSALNQMNVKNETNNKFRATKLWNEVLYAFFIGITPKKHRKNMKTYYNCFVASEAVDYLLDYLQMSPHFSEQQISRFQAINLLRKYLKTDIIERVDNKRPNVEFEDNKGLYRFTRHANENLPFISTTNLRQIDSTPKSSKSDKQIPNLLNELNLNEKSDAFKQIFFNKMLEFIPNIDDFVRRDEIISLNLMHNMTRISSNGVVQLTDKSQDLPHWVMSAIKCLANWPKASGSGSCLPKYPGFENDVFAVIRDYFVNIGIPLIPNQIYSLIIHIYDKFSTENIPIINSNNNNKFKINQNTNKTPVPPAMDKMKRQMNSNEKQLKTSTPILESQTPRTTVELPPNHVFETVFMGDIPITKIVSIDELTNLFKNNPRLKKTNSFRDFSSKKKNNFEIKENNRNTRYLDAITTIPRSGRQTQNPFKSPIVNNIYKCKYESPDSSTSSGDKSGTAYYNFGFAMQSPPEDGEYMLCKSVSSLSPINLSPNQRNNSKDNLSAQFSNSSNNCSLNLNSKSEQKLLKVLQMSLFLMPPSNRRHLHLLLRLLSKIIENKEIKFNLNKGIKTKDYILKTFTRSILCADKEIAFNELKAQKIVCILLDNCKDIFKVPNDLKEEIDRLLVQKAKQKLFGESQQFCQQITTEEFELQRDVLSEYALADLLRSIMTNDSLTDRDKLKWIKQFKSYHPEVYDLYFTNQIKVEQNFKHKKSDNNQRIRSQNSNLFKRFLSIRL